MAAQREPPWTTHEKVSALRRLSATAQANSLPPQNALLAEIIKVNAPNPHVLLNVINTLNMSPRLEELPLPPGPSQPYGIGSVPLDVAAWQSPLAGCKELTIYRALSELLSKRTRSAPS